jgi:hypothetical protein
MNEKLIAFYLKEDTDSEGRNLEEIWMWNDSDLEFQHDWVQVLFPTKKQSMFNADAPLLDDETIVEWKKDKLLQHNLRCSFQRALSFLGMKMEDGKIEFVEYPKVVWHGFNHNWLRITRILESLTLLGLETEAKLMLECLERSYEGCINNNIKLDMEASLLYWRDAVTLA